MKKKLLMGFFLLIITSLLQGCFDLGSFGGGDAYNAADPENIEEYYKAYYDAIGPIILCKQNHTLSTYSLKDSFFSKSTVNEMTWEDEDDAVDFNDYVYMAIKVEKDIQIDSLSLFMKSSSSSVGESQMKIYMYVLSKYIFLTIPKYDDPYYELDGSGNILYDTDGVTPLRESYDFMDKDEAIGSGSLTIKNNTFDSFTIGDFIGGADTYTVYKGQYIILSFYNNTCYGCHEQLDLISFTALNLLIRAI